MLRLRGNSNPSQSLAMGCGVSKNTSSNSLDGKNINSWNSVSNHFEGISDHFVT